MVLGDAWVVDDLWVEGVDVLVVLEVSVDNRAVVGGVVVHEVELDGSITDFVEEVDAAELSLEDHVESVVLDVVGGGGVSDVESGVGDAISVVGDGDLEELALGGTCQGFGHFGSLPGDVHASAVRESGLDFLALGSISRSESIGAEQQGQRKLHLSIQN